SISANTTLPLVRRPAAPNGRVAGMPMIEFPAGVTPEEAVELARQHSPHLFADSKPEAKDTSPDRGPAIEPLLTPAEVATMFRVDPKTVTKWAKAGKLTSIRTLGGHRRYRESE